MTAIQKMPRGDLESFPLVQSATQRRLKFLYDHVHQRTFALVDVPKTAFVKRTVAKYFPAVGLRRPPGRPPPILLCNAPTDVALIIESAPEGRHETSRRDRMDYDLPDVFNPV